MSSARRAQVGYSALTIALLAVVVVVYLWREAFDDASYAFLLAILSGTMFSGAQKVLAIRSEETLRKLAQVPQIEQLIAQAQGESAVIDNLRQELSKLEEVVEISARQRYLRRQQEALYDDAKKSLAQMKEIENEMSSMQAPRQSSVTIEEIEKLDEILKLREEGYFFLKIGKRRVPMHPRMFDVYPMPLGPFVTALQDYLARRRRRRQRENEHRAR